MATERIGQSNAISGGWAFEPLPAPTLAQAGQRDEVETVRAEAAARPINPTATRLMVLGRVMGRAEQVADGQVPHEGLEHSGWLFAAERHLEFWKVVEEVVHGPGLGGLIALPADAFMMAAYIGQANLDAKRVNEQREVVEAYAGGVAAALDPSSSPKPPADLGQRHAWQAGKQVVASMTNEERKELVNVLRDARARETGHAAPAAGATYREAVVGLWEGTVKARVY